MSIQEKISKAMHVNIKLLFKSVAKNPTIENINKAEEHVHSLIDDLLCNYDVESE